MGFLTSPGIGITEDDQTNSIPATSTSIGAYAGHFNWGPVDEIVTVGSEKELASIFGSPALGSSSRSFLTAASFLKYSNSLRVSRAIGPNALNAADQSPILIKNKDTFENLTSLNLTFAAKYPGDAGNGLLISYAFVSGAPGSPEYEAWPYKNLFSSAPNKSLTASKNNLVTNDEIHLVIIDKNGKFTGVKGSVLEKYEGLSLGSNSKTEEGATNYYKDVINTYSSYIYVDTLSSIFANADEDIIEGQSFSVIEPALETESKTNLPFKLKVETNIIYSGGVTDTSTQLFDKNVVVKSGYSGSIADNVKLNIRLIEQDDIAAKEASAIVYYRDPVNGDTINIDGIDFTKGDTNTNTFADKDGLIGAINGQSANVSAVACGDSNIKISALNTGAYGNNIVIVGNNTTLKASNDTLVNGSNPNSNHYVSINIDNLQSSNGFVTYDINVGTIVEDASTLESEVTLADIINELTIKRAAINDANLKDLKFFVDGVQINSTDALASMKIDFNNIIAFNSTNQNTLVVKTFRGGDEIVFADSTLLNTVVLQNGSDGDINTVNVVNALNLFTNKDLLRINLLFSENFVTDQKTIDAELYEIAESRRDLVAFISAPLGIESLSSNALKKKAVEDKFNDVNASVYFSSSFVFFDQTPLYTYNKFTDKYVWIPACGHMAGLCAHADFVADPWFSPAGFNRGQLRGVTKIAYNPSLPERNDLYSNRINSIITAQGEGVVLFGDKTALTKSSAFSHINVRRLFNVIEAVISEAAKYQLFELNDEFTRAAFKNTVEPFLRDVQGRRGIIDFRVVCDEFNNNEEVIDNNRFVGDIFVKPARSINFINLNFISTRTGVDFKEIVGS